MIPSFALHPHPTVKTESPISSARQICGFLSQPKKSCRRFKSSHQRRLHHIGGVSGAGSPVQDEDILKSPFKFLQCQADYPKSWMHYAAQATKAIPDYLLTLQDLPRIALKPCPRLAANSQGWRSNRKWPRPPLWVNTAPPEVQNTFLLNNANRTTLSLS